MSSLKDLASLIMIPSLVKDGRLDTVKPLGNSIIHPDATGNNDGTDGSTPAEGNFTFTRGSNLSATRVDASQLIEKGRENLLLQSNQFDTTWTTGATLTSGQSGYNGNNAWKFASSSGGQTGVQQSVSFSNIHTFSVYAKAGSVDFIKLFVVQSGTNRTCVIDLSDGSIANDNSVSASSPAASVTSLANGWYRIEMPTNANSATFVRIRPQLSEGDDNLSVGDFIYIQDTQVEQSLVATPYIETGASTAQAGILENTPRFDYSGGATCPSLLLEPSRTNLVTQSEYFASWYQSGATTTTNNAISPDGTLNASLITIPSGGYGSVYTIPTSISGTTYTSSVYGKKGNQNYLSLEYRVGAFSGNADAVFDLNTGVVTSGTGIIEDVGNGWYRCSVTKVSTSSSALLIIGRGISGSSNDTVYLYGAETEAGSYPTSYIPTYGVSQTRAFDDCRKTGISSLIGQTEGTLFGELTFKSAEPTNRLFSITGTDWNSVGSIRFDIISLKPQATIRSLGGEPAKIIGTQDINVNSLVKFALVYTSTTLKMFVNGAQIGSTATLIGSLPSPINEITINALGGGFTNALQNNQLNPYKQAIVFKTALSDLDCEILTGATTYNTFAAMALALNYTVYE